MKKGVLLVRQQFNTKAMKIIITFINGFLSVVLFAATIVCICAPQESISKKATFGLLFLTIYVVCNFIALIQNEEKP